MAEQSVHDVVNQTMSVGAHSPSDAHDNKPTRNFIGGEITTPGTNLNIQEDDGSEQDVQPSQGDSVGSAMTNGQTNVCCVRRVCSFDVLVLTMFGRAILRGCNLLLRIRPSMQTAMLEMQILTAPYHETIALEI